MKVLVIMHEPYGPAGEIGAHLADRGFDITVHLVTDDLNEPNTITKPFPEFDEFDLIVPMGSIRSLTRKSEIDSWVSAELQALGDAHERDQPILGICFGGQLLAETVGGSVDTAPSSEIGWFQLKPADPSNDPIGPGPWMEWHHDRFWVPSTSTVLAHSGAGQQLFRSGRSVGTQFHPEITVQILEGWLAGSEPEYLDRYGVNPERLWNETRNNEGQSRAACRRFVDWFVDSVAFQPGGMAQVEGSR